MADPTLDDVLATYLAQPVTGERSPAAYSLSPSLILVLERLAMERNVPVDVLVEFALFKQLRAEHARRLVGERPDPIPASFLNTDVARAKVELTKDVAAIKATEGRGDRADRIASGLERMLNDATGNEEIDELRRRTAVLDAQADMALNKTKK